MQLEKNQKIRLLLEATMLIVAFVGVPVIASTMLTSGFLDLTSVMESKGCLIYQTYPSKVDCAASIASSGPLKT
jgi:hypothetical protein